MFIEKELYYGWYEQCIMCGYTYDFKEKINSDYKLIRVRNGKRQKRFSLHPAYGQNGTIFSGIRDRSDVVYYYCRYGGDQLDADITAG